MKHVDGEKPAVSPRRTSECYLFGLVRIAKIRRCRDTHGSNALPVLDAFGSECLYMVRVRNIWEQLHVTLGGCSLPVSRLVTASVCAHLVLRCFQISTALCSGSSIQLSNHCHIVIALHLNWLVVNVDFWLAFRSFNASGMGTSHQRVDHYGVQ